MIASTFPFALLCLFILIFIIKVIKDNNSKKLVGLGYLWFERKYTRRICTLLHIGELFTDLSLSPDETAEVEFL